MGRQHVESGTVLKGGEKYGNVGPILNTLGAKIFPDSSCTVPEPRVEELEIVFV